jgi:post-segregation antitoxin (ccd killing protein)
MNMRQRNSAKPKPKLQVYVSQEVADRLRDYASLVGVSASFATEMALRTYLNMEKVKI